MAFYVMPAIFESSWPSRRCALLIHQLNSGVATEEDLGLDTLMQRLGEAFMSANAVFSSPTVVGGWDGDPSRCSCAGFGPVPGMARPARCAPQGLRRFL
jgi:hypothetical protein